MKDCILKNAIVECQRKSHLRTFGKIHADNFAIVKMNIIQHGALKFHHRKIAGIESAIF